MKSKDQKLNIKRAGNNKTIKELLKENNTSMEVAEEIKSTKKIGDVLGDRLSKTKHFPPC